MTWKEEAMACSKIISHTNVLLDGRDEKCIKYFDGRTFKGKTTWKT
jgi:hypothetical protein